MRTTSTFSAHKLTFFLLLALLTSLPLSIPAQQPPGDDPRLAKIEFLGLKRLRPDQLLKVSGLELGQPTNIEALDAAAQRLLDSGLVHNLSYRLQTKAGAANVTFQIEEGRGGQSEVIFDNFIWFSDEELFDAVRREVPSFNGAAPNAGNLTEAIARALQKFLNERKIGGTIEYLPAENADHTKLEHVFAVKGVRIPICSVHFPGARNVSEDKLIQQAQELLGRDYSRRFTALFALSSLFPLYRELGQLRATFSKPQASAQTLGDCKDGVELTIPVDEGAIYVWDKTEWTGNHVLTRQELDAALSLKPGEIANGIKFDKGIAVAVKAYGRKGYLETALHPETLFDDAERKVSYQVDVREGPQYRMGDLIIRGFSENLGNYLRGKWEMKREDVYDQGYFENFLKQDFSDVMRKVLAERQEQGRPKPKKIITAQRPNRDSLTVDVTFELGDEP